MAVKYPLKVTVRMTREMHANLRRVAGSDREIPQTIRSMIRFGLDHSDELAGSRRFFTGRFRDAVMELQTLLRWHLSMNIILLAIIAEFVLNYVRDEDDDPFRAVDLIRLAIDQTALYGARVQAMIHEDLAAHKIDYGG
jgi:hypothetical protein